MKIKKINIVEDQNTLCEAVFENGQKAQLQYSMFTDDQVKEYLRESEGISIRECGDLIIIIVLFASAQGGYVIVWNYADNTIVHISEGSYVYYATIVNKSVITLRLASSFVHPPEFGYSICPLGIDEPFKECDFTHLDLDPAPITDPFNQCRIDVLDSNVRFVALNQSVEISL